MFPFRVFYDRVKHCKHPEKIKILAIKMYSEGMIKSAIAKVLNLPYGTTARLTYEIRKYLDKYLSKKWKKLANNIDVYIV